MEDSTGSPFVSKVSYRWFQAYGLEILSDFGSSKVIIMANSLIVCASSYLSGTIPCYQLHVLSRLSTSLVIANEASRELYYNTNELYYNT